MGPPLYYSLLAIRYSHETCRTTANYPEGVTEREYRAMPVRKMARSPSIVGGADAVEDVRDQMAAIEDALEEMTVDHPKTMLGLALAAGFALGLIYRASRGRA